MLRLSDCAHGRDNNFNLLRIIAALAVLVSHSFSLTTGNLQTEPLVMRLGVSLGTIAVDSFFVMSGFLVCSSLLRRENLLDFFWARFLRIMPALSLVLVLSALLLGPLLSELSPAQYFSNSQTWLYIARGLAMITGMPYFLPGVFADNPYAMVVNGSLWTLPYEVAMYGLLVGVWLLASQFKKYLSGSDISQLFLLVCVLFALWMLWNFYTVRYVQGFAKLGFLFFVGASCYVWRASIRLSWWGFALCVALLALASLSARWFFLPYVLLLGYMLFCLAYLPAGALRAYNQLGDYSYGVYIFTFPVQQTLVLLMPGVNVWQLMVLSASITLMLAMASWHGLERQALDFKGTAVGWCAKRLRFRGGLD